MSETAKVFDFSAAHRRRSSRMENQKQGHFALFRSLLSKDWAKDTAKLAMWVRLIGEASYKPRKVEFAGKSWDLQPGELVTTAAILARKLRDQDGGEKSPQAVTRMINFFSREGMITTKGTRFGTVICITNYSEYQVILPDEPSDRPSDNNKPSAGASLKGLPDEPSDRPSDEQNKKGLEQELNNKTLPPAEDVKKPRKTFQIDKERFKSTWNSKAQKHGLPKIRSVSATHEKGLKYLFDAHLRQCRELGKQPKDIDTLINGYIEFGYQPTEWACGHNPTGTKYGIETALKQEKIDQILSQED